MTQDWTRYSTAHQAALILMAALCLIIGVMAGTKAALAASLKPIGLIEGEMITVGDIFDNAGRHHDYVIGAAPKPGQEMTLNARTLYRIASALDLSWRPSTSADKITLRREANIIDTVDIKNAIEEELKNNGLSGLFDIELNDRSASIILSKNDPQDFEFTKFNFNQQRDYFTATIAAPSTDNPVKTLKVSGTIDRLIEVPVLKSPLKNGDIIGKNDITMVTVSTDRLQHNVIMDMNDMIGLTPRRVAHAGKFVLDGSLEFPQLVKRGDKVNITFQSGPLVLTAEGKALQSGAKGDHIRVTNAGSSKTIDAVITGENEVIVR